jgi:hypothetical protein
MYNHYKKYVEANVFSNVYMKLLEHIKLDISCLLMDTTYVPNKRGINLKRHPRCQNKRCIRVSLLTDKCGVPISLISGSSNKNDTLYFDEHIDDLSKLVSVNANINSGNALKYFLADTAYYSNYIMDTIKLNKMIPLIPQPKRANRAPHLVKIFTPKEKKIYKNRINIEHTNAHIKSRKILTAIYTRDVSTYMQQVYALMIFRFL